MSKLTLFKFMNSLKQKLLNLLDPETDASRESQFNDQGSVEEQISDYKMNEVLSRRVKAIINDFVAAAPIIEEAGFRIRDLEIELSVIPKLIPHFEKLHSVDEDKKQEVIDKVEHQKLIKMLIKALFKADHFQQNLKMGRLEFAGIEVEVTAIPAIRLLYKNTFNETKDNKSIYIKP